MCNTPFRLLEMGSDGPNVVAAWQAARQVQAVIGGDARFRNERPLGVGRALYEVIAQTMLGA